MSIQIPSAAENNQIGDALGGLVLDHAGMAVVDAVATARTLAAVFGVRQWRRMVFRTEAVYRGTPETVGGTVLTGSLGPIKLELVQPTEGHWTAADVLRERGECLYHLGFRTGDLKTVQAGSANAGLVSMLTGLDAGGTALFEYLQPTDLPNLTIEVVGPEIPEGFVVESETLRFPAG
ncbi:VOC family protein [Parafrankia discariae]|uniref:VOC family protein n=1 Tax=Parafrankia discariae TaxID=365528 RepID=UPI000376A818|nr:VOC family protein [Parafrankia discariae]